MAKNTQAFFTKDARFKPTNFTDSDGTTAKQIFDPSLEGSRVDAIIISSTAATDKVLLLQLNDGTNISQLGAVSVPANAGTDGIIPIVSGLNRTDLPWLKIDANGNPYINLNSGMNLEAKLLVALGVGEEIDITIQGANYDA